MKGKFRMTQEAAHRGQTYLDAYSDKIALSPSARALFDAELARLDAFGLDQAIHTGLVAGSKTTLEVLRQAIRDEFINIIQEIADMELMDKRDYPALKMRSRVKEHDFLVKATVMMAAAAKYPSVFAEYGKGPEFFLRFKSAISGLAEAMDSRGRSEGTKQGARAGIEASEKAVRAWLKHIDGLIAPDLKHSDTATLAGWRAASKIHKLPVTPRRGGDLNQSDGDDQPSA
jgi:hypothetical protein